MQLILDEDFEFEGCNYSIRGVFTGTEILVRAFDGKRPASPMTSISFETALDLSPSNLAAPASILAGWCKTFVTDKTAEQLEEVMKQLRERSIESTNVEESIESESSIPVPTEEDFNRILRQGYAMPPLKN
jgi:hypothetical protein